MQKELRDFVYTAMDALRGILLSSFVDRDPRPRAAALGPGLRAPAGPRRRPLPADPGLTPSRTRTRRARCAVEKIQSGLYVLSSE